MQQRSTSSTSNDWLEQLAAILAYGVIRYRKLVRRSETTNSRKICGDGLEVSSDTRLTVSRAPS